MSTRGLEFAEQWVRGNVRSRDYVSSHQQDDRPADFSRLCLTEAGRGGITQAEIEDEVGPLDHYFERAIDRATDRERLAAQEEMKSGHPKGLGDVSVQRSQ